MDPQVKNMSNLHKVKRVWIVFEYKTPIKETKKIICWAFNPYHHQ